jgi:predicted nucleic acid-binding protein
LKKEKNEQDFEQENKPERIYLDSNIFIYSVNENTKEQEKAKEIIKKIKGGYYLAFTSTLTIDEFLWAIQKASTKEIASNAAEIFFTLPNLVLVNIDSTTIKNALEQYKNTFLNPRDAIHLAAMKQKNLTTIYSTDPDFDNIKGIKRIDLS